MNSYDYSQPEPGNEMPSCSPPPQICQNNGPAMTENDFMAPPCPLPSPPPPSQQYRAEVPSNSHNMALPRSDAIETPSGVITPENLIWDPPNLQEFGPLKLLGVYNLPPPFWPASLKDKVKNLGINVDETNRADDSSNMKNPSFSVPHNTFEELLKNLDFSTPSPHANEDMFEIPGLSVDAYNEQTDAVIEQEEDKLNPDVITSHNMEAAAFDSEELLSYVTGSKKRKWTIFFDNDSSSAPDESSAMFDDLELFEPPHAEPQLDSNEYVEDFFTTLYSAIFSDESTVSYD
ncbi:hypothetical protein G5714_007184 [Onychostoma macrolepis]|uniref:Uncharacterized protein n=1 Tax=Onychostoma macrolepis TaxID=369639 RepID=A0A7J6CZL6_9TELE|nr:hypothetical protein G5714_007184 [Onychostoma macrolepis]